jgi:hypothetical protein
MLKLGTTYKNNVISFRIPTGYKVTECINDIAWTLKKNVDNLICIDVNLLWEIDVFLSRQKSIDELPDKIFPNGDTYKRIKLSVVNLPKFEINYCGDIGEKKGNIFTKRLEGLIFCKEYCLHFEIRESKNFELKDYFGFFNSIIVNEKKYQIYIGSLKNETSVDSEVNNVSSIIFNYPIGFSDKHKQEFLEGVLLKNNEFEIELYDVSGLGREADITTFAERKKNKIAEKNACMKNLKKRKCFIQSFENKKIDLSRCKNLRVLMSFQGNCVDILINSKREFDIVDFSDFLSSIQIHDVSNMQNKYS